MSVYPLCQIVTAPSVTAAVLHDLSSDVGEGTWVQAAGNEFTLGEPGWTQGPAGIIEGTREITLPVMIEGTTGVRDGHLLSLSQALTRPHRTVYLLWQLDGSAEPRWYRLHQPHKAELDWSRVYVDHDMRSMYRLDLVVTADAFGIGPQVTIPTSAFGSIGAQDLQMGKLLPDIKGNVPAPLVLDLKPNYSWAGWQQLVNIAAVTGDSDYTGSRFWVASGFSPSAGVVANGASWTWDESLSTGADGGEVISGSGATTVAPGTYKILALVRHTGNALGGGWIKAGTKFFGLSTTGPWTAWNPSTANDQSWVDCGVRSLPAGIEPMTTMRSADMQAPTFTVRWRWNGVDDGLVRAYSIDGLMIIPADGVTGAASPPCTFMPTWGLGSPDSTNWGRIDSEAERVGVVTNTSNLWVNCPPAIPDGGYLYVTPGARNYMTVLNRVNPTGNASLSGQVQANYIVTARAWYRPRYTS